MQARYYDPVIGRFYSNDPVGSLENFSRGSVQGLNRFNYAYNNPYRYIDPDGHSREIHLIHLNKQERMWSNILMINLHKII